MRFQIVFDEAIVEREEAEKDSDKKGQPVKSRRPIWRRKNREKIDPEVNNCPCDTV